MIDNKSQYLNLPLPDPNNTLSEDVLRIKQSFQTVDQVLGTLQQNSITQGDSAVTVTDSGTGKVTFTLDGAESASVSSKHMVIPKGTTAERPSSAALGSLRYNTTTGFFETFTISGWGAIATPPTITTITPLSFNGEQGTAFTINGAFFDSYSQVKFVTAQGAQFTAASVTFINASQLIATTPKDFTVAEEPLSVSVTNSAGLTAVSAPLIDCGSVPTWNTAAGNIATTTKWNDPVSVYVSAADDGTIASYALSTGALPSGVTLNAANGLISGNPSAQNTTTYTFTIVATDNAGNTSSRQFTIIITNAAPTWSTAAGTLVTTSQWNSPISTTITATDPEGQAVTYSIVSGTLPTGVSLNSSTGAISGTDSSTPNAVSKTVNFTAAATDVSGAQSTRAFALQIVNAAPVWSAPASGATVTFVQGISNSVSLSAADPEGQAVTYSLASGTLPTGLSISGNTLSGTASGVTGSYPLTISASDGYSAANRSFTLLVTVIGQIEYTTSGTYSFVVPNGVYSVSAVAVGAGGSASGYFGAGGGGGALAYKNNISVTPGQTLTVVVGAPGAAKTGTNAQGVAGGASSLAWSGGTMTAGGGGAPSGSAQAGSSTGGAPSGTYDGGGSGGGCPGAYTTNAASIGASTQYAGAGGGGAGGYSGNGGNGAGAASSSAAMTFATAGAGGGGGGGGSRAADTAAGSWPDANGGGVGIYGQGTNGAAGVNYTTNASTAAPANCHGQGGSGGSAGSSGASAADGGFGGSFGGGGGSWHGAGTTSYGGTPGGGAVRIIWGPNRAFPSTNTGNM